MSHETPPEHRDHVILFLSSRVHACAHVLMQNSTISIIPKLTLTFPDSPQNWHETRLQQNSEERNDNVKTHINSLDCNCVFYYCAQEAISAKLVLKIFS